MRNVIEKMCVDGKWVVINFGWAVPRLRGAFFIAIPEVQDSCIHAHLTAVAAIEIRPASAVQACNVIIGKGWLVNGW